MVSRRRGVQRGSFVYNPIGEFKECDYIYHMYIAILCSWLFCAVKNCLNLIDCILSRNESGRVVKGFSFGLKSFTLRLNDFVLDCLSATSWLLFVCSQLVCFQPIEIFKLFVYLPCLLTICVSEQEEPLRKMSTAKSHYVRFPRNRDSGKNTKRGHPCHCDIL